jgi:predicted permease
MANGEFQIEGGTSWGPNDAPLVEYRWMSGEYTRTLGIPLLKGRMLDERDGDGTRTVLINQAMADKFWPGQDPIGRRFGQGQDVSTWYEVVGVLGDTRSYGLQQNAPFEFYQTIEQSSFSSMTVVVRTRSADPTSVMPTVRRLVAGLDPALPIGRVQTLEQVVSGSIGRPRLLSALTAVFGGLAGLLAAVGVYGMMAYNVRQQRREFGIRLALGAAQGAVGRLVVTRALVLSVVGIAAGALGAWAVSGVLSSMLHDVKPTDPTVFAGIATLTIAIAVIASYLPARAASRVDPLVVLRDD